MNLTDEHRAYLARFLRDDPAVRLDYCSNVTGVDWLDRTDAEVKEVMQPGMRNRLRIAVLIYSMTNAVIFGTGIITVLNVSALRANAFFWIPVVVVASLILAAPIAWLIAPRLQARYDRRHTQ